MNRLLRGATSFEVVIAGVAGANLLTPGGAEDGLGAPFPESIEEARITCNVVTETDHSRHITRLSDGNGSGTRIDKHIVQPQAYRYLLPDLLTDLLPRYLLVVRLGCLSSKPYLGCSRGNYTENAKDWNSRKPLRFRPRRRCCSMTES